MSGLMPEPAGYAELLEQLKARVRTSRVRAARAANSELLALYWSVGRDIRQVGAGEVQASSSTRTLTVELTNVSDDRCTVAGFGGLALLDAGGAQQPTNIQRGDEQPRTIELAPRGSTTRELSWRVVPTQGADPDGDCASGDVLLVTPPDEEPGDLVVDEAITACEGGTITGTPWDREAG